MKEQIIRLRERMEQNGIDFYVVTTTDAHNSEYVSDHDMVLKYLTGFTGSNGTLLVSAKEALLWTDGRYYIQCEKELAGSGIKMMREGDDRDPSIDKYIGEHMEGGQCLAYNGFCITKHMAGRYVSKCAKKAVYRTASTGSDVTGVDTSVIYVRTDVDLAGDIWNEEGNRPSCPDAPVTEHELKYAGESVAQKLARVRGALKNAGACSLMISSLPDIMWLYNIRGNDVMYNPVAFSYAFVTVDTALKDLGGSGDNDLSGEAYLFIRSGVIAPELSEKLGRDGVVIREYDDICAFLKDYEPKGNVMADPRELSVSLYDTIEGKIKGSGDHRIIDRVIPTNELKAVKNDTEIAMMKDFFLRDSYAMSGYLYAVKKIMGCDIPEEMEGLFSDDTKINAAIGSNSAQEFDELKAGKLCDEIRLNTEGCFDLSFTTIAAYGGNAAMMHYEATEESYSEVQPKGMLLTDCGGQYPGATTDVTRTIAVGPVTDEEKKSFTLVIKGWLSLMHATWIEGCTGRNLDILARQYLWNEGIDYKCGTGHGVGYCLGVHEGPQNIRWRYIEGSSEAVLHPGMVVTNEPGVYRESEFGIRTENTMLVVKKFESDGDTYLGFENLTWVPIDMDLVDLDLLDDKEKVWLADYNDTAYTKLNGLEKTW